nr:uncharacterized protein LOC111973066 isoform X4 [Salvelinus alpinus]
MSDSDSGPEFVDYDDIRHGGKFTKDSPFVALQPPDDKCERWNKIPVSLKKKAAQLMHVSAFWYHILLCRENHNTTRWAVQVGFLDSNVSNDLSLKRLHRIEILEAILRAMEKGCLLDQTRHMIWISNTFNLKSEEMKAKENYQFQKKKYDAAVKYYSKAIKYQCCSHPRLTSSSLATCCT